jgi:preprotein translocase subunit YajC
LISILSDFIFIVAQNGDGEEASGVTPYLSYLILGGVVVAFYFLMIRPGQKQRKAHQKLVSSIKKGDEVMSAGGFFGTVTKVGDDHVMVELSKKNIVKLSRNSIARIVSQEEEEYEEEDYEEEFDEELEEEEFVEEELEEAEE